MHPTTAHNQTRLTAYRRSQDCPAPHTPLPFRGPQRVHGATHLSRCFSNLSSDLSNPTPSCKSSSYHRRRFPPLPLIYHLLDLNSPLPTYPQSSPSPGAKGPALALLCKAFAPSTHHCPFPPAGASQTLLPAGAGPGCGHLSAQHPAYAWQRAVITE